nr:ATP-binding protein [uncultured Allomuricauda sp.]
MYPRSNNRFTLKIVVSYLVLGLLALLAGIFIYSQFKNYTSSQNIEDDNLKLLKTNALFAELYEAENLSKLATQSNKTKNLQAYARKVDSMASIIDTLKLLTSNDNQTNKLDSIQKLLLQKVYNSAELRKLKVQNRNSTSIDSLLKTFHKMEVDMGRITPETFVPNFNTLPLETQKSIQEYVALLNKNIPSESGKSTNSNTLDSILEVSKSFLQEAKIKNLRVERSVAQKELEIYRTDLELSQKLRSIISSLEKEIILNTYWDNFNKQQILRKSIWLAGGAVLLGLLVVIIFTFLISKDFWRIQEYRKQLEKEKKYSESILKSREQLISTVSHDLKTPLNTVSGYAELMEHSGLNNKQLTYLKKVKSALGYMESLANDLLDFSKLEVGKITIEKVPFLLYNLIIEVASHFKEVNSYKDIDLVFEVSEVLKKPILSDPFRIRQILTNLIGNAFKFTNEGFVKINAFVEDKEYKPFVKIQVIDSGIGVEPENQELIFQEFTQAEDSTEKKYGGYGLGLTISKKLTTLLGGSLTLESKKNKGSTFQLSLPLEFSNMAIPLQNPSIDDFKYQLSVLIFDDDETMQELLKEVLEIHQITTHTFSCFTAFEKTADFNYDIVLTDIQMPKVDGFKVLQKLKSGDFTHYKNQPIVAMTGQKELNKSRYLSAGFVEVLQKPFSNTHLLDTLAHFVDFLPKVNSGAVTIPKNSSSEFSTNTVASFVETPEALRSVLESFLEETAKNMASLSKGIKNNIYSKVRNVSHRMLPMFRQLNVSKAIPILEKFEHISSNAIDKKDFELLKRTVLNLEKEIHAYLAKLPVDID